MPFWRATSTAAATPIAPGCAVAGQQPVGLDGLDALERGERLLRVRAEGGHVRAGRPVGHEVRGERVAGEEGADAGRQERRVARACGPAWR